MSSTKRELVRQAFGRARMSSTEYDIDPTMFETGLRRLDDMIASWGAVGLSLGYTLGPTEAGLDEDSGLPRYAEGPVIACLAEKLADEYGQPLSQILSGEARDGFAMLTAKFSAAPTMPNHPALPRGAGWRGAGYCDPYFPPPCDPLEDDKGRPIR